MVYSEEEPGRAAAPPSPLLALPNVTARPPTASVPITVSLYDGPLLCGFNVTIEGLNADVMNDELCVACIPVNSAAVAGSALQCVHVDVVLSETAAALTDAIFVSRRSDGPSKRSIATAR